jgi:hypothetical protein
MDKSQLRVRPGFILWLLVIFVGFPWLGGFFLRVDSGKTKAKIVVTQNELTAVGGLANQLSARFEILPLDTNSCLLPGLLSSEGRKQLRNYFDRTNAQGELIDLWRTSIKIEHTFLSNVIIRSAGPDRKLGNRDDLVFDVSKDDFVKP